MTRVRRRRTRDPRDPLGLSPEQELAARLDPSSPHRAALPALDAAYGTQAAGPMAGRPSLHALYVQVALHAAGRDDARALFAIEQAQEMRRELRR